MRERSSFRDLERERKRYWGLWVQRKRGGVQAQREIYINRHVGGQGFNERYRYWRITRDINLVLRFMEREREIERGRLGFKALERYIQHQGPRERKREIKVQDFREIEREREILKVRVFQREIMGQGFKEGNKNWGFGV